MILIKKKLLKYFFIFKIACKNNFFYFKEQFLSTIFLIFVLFSFFSLWQTVFGTENKPLIEGYSLKQMIWYLVFTEAVILSQGKFAFVIEEEVQTGTLALRLNRPYSYLLFHYFHCMGETFSRFLVILGVGSTTAYFLVGGIEFGFHLLPPLFLILVTTQLLHFLYNYIIGLLAFWMEEISGPFFVLDRIKWLLGGFFVPIEIFPENLQKIVSYLPFKDMIYGPAKLFVSFNYEFFFHVLTRQIFWGVFLLLISVFIFSLGKRDVAINGG